MRHRLVIVFLAALLGASPAAAATFFDVFFDVTLDVTIDGSPLSLQMMGPARIQVGDPGVPGGPIPIEMVSLSLSGSASTSLAGASLGQLVPSASGGGAVDSFFDIFVEIDLPAVGVFMNLQALRLVGPPGPDPFAIDSFFDVFTEIDLLDPAGNGRGSVDGGRFTVPEPSQIATLAAGLAALVALAAPGSPGRRPPRGS